MNSDERVSFSGLSQDMNYGHIFSAKSKEALSEFIRASKSCEEYHDFDTKGHEHKLWGRFMAEYKETDIFLEEPELSGMVPFKEDDVTKKELPRTSFENLEVPMLTEDKIEDELLCEYLIMDIQNEPAQKIFDIYRQFLPRIDMLRLLEMGKIIITINPHHFIIECYCRVFLFQMMSEMFNERLKIFFYEFYAHYSSLVNKEILYFFEVHDELKTFLLYTNFTSSKEKELISSLLRAFVVSFRGPLTKNHIIILDHLTGECTEYNLIKLIIDILSVSAEEFKEDKDYGKLLVKITENLGPEVDSLRSQIESILSIHASIWKIKLRKIMKEYSAPIH